MTSKIITIVGATRTQVGGIIDFLVGNPEYKLRGLTRKPASASAQELKAKGVEVVKADLNDLNSLHAAFSGSYGVYGVTDMPGMRAELGDNDAAIAAEERQGINIAKACLETPGLQHFIWSTLPDSVGLSNGTFDLPNFRGKVAVDNFIRAHSELLAKTTFFFISQYASNYNYGPLAPHLIPGAGDGKGDTYVQFVTHPPDTPITTIGDVRRNIGPFVAAILAQPEKTRGGTTVLAHVEVVPAEESLQMWADARGVRAISIPVSAEKLTELFGSFDFLGLMWRFWAALGDRAWGLPSGGKVVTKDDLGVTGLIGQAESFLLKMQG
ncbi:hypothetical protein KVR01_013315 [Diaporthe batatas]|uniref:uncharacterized protein n=1 Tax=Diaporthe batatas TaxID=748121 RepID=UPI001D051723|nr:uncharacterized protein KVR01_013315 [Diaporthe batatas]KAG8156902.1 hypothetical protein KVR01_013315 [Diaporthe batatas]